MTWRRVEGFDMYEVNGRGTIRNRHTGLTIRQRTDSDGYKLVTLTRGRAPATQTTLKVHRIVATAFLTKPSPAHSEVDHIDGHRANNAAVNLRWATSELNHLNRRNVRGVRLHHSGRWQAYSSVKRRFVHIGNFDTEAEALMARRAYIDRRVTECTQS